MAKKVDEKQKPVMPLGKENYILMIIGVLIIIIGFILMSGGKAENPSEFNPAIFSTRRIVIAPVIVLFGFVFEIWAIMKKPGNKENSI